MEQIRGTGSTTIEAEVVDRYTDKDSGTEYGVALIEGERLPVLRYEGESLWYVDTGEVVR